eukprot:1448396-Prymnesium_polylepis.1
MAARGKKASALLLRGLVATLAAPDARPLPPQLPLANDKVEAAGRGLGVRRRRREHRGCRLVCAGQLRGDEQAVGAHAAPGAGARPRGARA